MAGFSIKAKIGATTSAFRRSASRLKGFTKRLFGGIGGVLAGVFSAGLLKGLFSEFDRLAKLAKTLRLPAPTVQKFDVAAKLAGTTVETLAKSLLQAERNAIKAQQGLVTYQRSFGDLNINTRDFLKLDMEGRLLALTAAYEKTDDKSRASAASMELLGRGGKDLIPIFQEGEEGLRKMLDEIDTLESRNFRAIEEINDQMTLLANNIKTEMLPGLLTLVEFLYYVQNRLRLGVAALKEYGSEVLKVGLAIATVGASLLNEDLRPDFGGATEDLEAEYDALNRQLDSFLDKIDRARKLGNTGGLDVEGLRERARAMEALNKLQDDATLKRERTAAAERGWHQEFLLLAKQRSDIRKELAALGEVGTDADANKEILELKKRELDLQRDIEAVIQKGVDKNDKLKEALKQLEVEKKIAQLRADGNEKGAAALERHTDLLADARAFLEGVGEEASGANLEAVFGRLQEIQNLRDKAADSQIQRDGVFSSLRSVGGNDPIGVALSGPLDRTVEAQKETTRAVESQTKTLEKGLRAVADAAGQQGEVTFAKLS